MLDRSQYLVKSFDVRDGHGRSCGTVDFDQEIDTFTIDKVVLFVPPPMAGPNDEVFTVDHLTVQIGRGVRDDGRPTFFLKWVEGIEKTTRFSPRRNALLRVV